MYRCVIALELALALGARASPGHSCTDWNPIVGVGRCHRFGRWSEGLWTTVDAGVLAERRDVWLAGPSLLVVVGFARWFYFGEEMVGGVSRDRDTIFGNWSIPVGVRRELGPITLAGELAPCFASEDGRATASDRFELTARARLDFWLGHGLTLDFVAGTGATDSRERVYGIALGMHPAL